MIDAVVLSFKTTRWRDLSVQDHHGVLRVMVIKIMTAMLKY